MRPDRLRLALPAPALMLVAAVAAACSAGPEQRARGAAARAEIHAPVRTTEIVQDLRTTPDEPGRLIYEPPVDLSYANLRRTRPDLLRLDSTSRVPSRTSGPLDTTRAERPHH